MKLSLQKIEDSYVNLGHTGEELRKALSKDKNYQKLLKQRKQKLSAKFSLSANEKQKYVLSTNKDFEILRLCKKLEEINLKKEDKILVNLIKTQLQHDWRRPLTTTLKKLLEKYQAV